MWFKKQKINERCRICKFYIGQDCRKKAPTLAGESPSLPHWPYMKWDDWCGDFKLDKEDHERFDK